MPDIPEKTPTLTYALLLERAHPLFWDEVQGIKYRHEKDFFRCRIDRGNANPPSGNDSDGRGWKVHLSVEGSDVPRAFDLIVDSLERHGAHEFKVATPDTTQNFSDRRYAQAGKMITIYDSGYHSGASNTDWPGLLREMESILSDNGIKPGPIVSSDRQVTGSQYAFYRNDRSEEGTYVKADHRAKDVAIHNPQGSPDPLATIDVSDVYRHQDRIPRASDIVIEDVPANVLPTLPEQLHSTTFTLGQFPEDNPYLVILLQHAHTLLKKQTELGNGGESEGKGTLASEKDAKERQLTNLLRIYYPEKSEAFYQDAKGKLINEVYRQLTPHEHSPGKREAATKQAASSAADLYDSYSQKDVEVTAKALAKHAVYNGVGSAEALSASREEVIQKAAKMLRADYPGKSPDEVVNRLREIMPVIKLQLPKGINAPIRFTVESSKGASAEAAERITPPSPPPRNISPEQEKPGRRESQGL